jgi:hypothetical protein
MCLADRLRRGAALLSLALQASCALPPPDRPAPQGEVVVAGACRVGPDGGPPRADRGIGGTGAPAQAVQQAERGIGGTGVRPGTTLDGDRGIGGTGAPSQAVLQADRGIGGTGIVAVITGFASVCLGGREVALDAGVPVLVDAADSVPAALRAGQVAIVEAAGAGGELRAVRIRVRHEVSGPVEAVEAGGMLRVAGQRVAITAETLGERAPTVGQWVAVSGLHRPDEVILATRVDPRVPGPVTVHGLLLQAGIALRIGTLEVRPREPVLSGQYVTASGRYADGVLYAEGIVPDLLVTNPTAYFGPGVDMFLFEAFTAESAGRLRLGPGLEVTAQSGLGRAAPGRAIVELERSEGGSLRATSLRQSGPASDGPGGGRAGPGFGGRLGPGDGVAGPGGHLGGPSAPTAAPVPNRMPGLDGPGTGTRDGWSNGRFGERGAPGVDRGPPSFGPGSSGAGPFGPGGFSGGFEGRSGGRGR